MHYIGLDVHKKQSTFCLLDENGRKMFTKTIHGTWGAVIDELSRQPKPFAICYEASTGYGYLHEQFCQIATQVAVAHPGHLRMIFRSKRKNDRTDAEKLAKLLYLDEVPQVYVPSGEIRAWRRMIEFRHRLVGDRTRVKNAIRALCRSNGIVSPKNLWSKPGLYWLGQQQWPDDMTALHRDMLLDRVITLDSQILRAEKVLDDKARNYVGPSILRSIPGVGPRTAEAMVAYVDEAQRFSNSKSSGCYFGMIPSQDASASSNHLGHITKQGPATVRKLLVEAAWQGKVKSPTIRAYYERIKRGDKERKKIAIVATAHYLARVMVAMLKNGELWHEDASVARQKLS